VKYQIYATWAMSTIVEVEADSFEGAVSKVVNDEIELDLDSEGDYVDSSFQVLREFCED
jgi:hypothetical protein